MRSTKLSQQLFKLFWMCVFWVLENWLFTILLIRFNICFRCSCWLSFSYVRYMSIVSLSICIYMCVYTQKEGKLCAQIRCACVSNSSSNCWCPWMRCFGIFNSALLWLSLFLLLTITILRIQFKRIPKSNSMAQHNVITRHFEILLYAFYVSIRMSNSRCFA